MGVSASPKQTYEPIGKDDQSATSGLLHTERTMTVSKPKRSTDKTSTKRASAHLARLAERGGAPVRVDTAGPDLKLLDELVAGGYAPSRTEAYRQAMREAHARWKEGLDSV